MKDRKSSRFVALIMVCAIVCSALTGCAGYGLKKREDTVSYVKADTSDVFKQVATPLDTVKTYSVESEDDMGEGGLMFSSSFAKNGKYYILYSDMESAETTSLSIFDADGKNDSLIHIPVSENGMVNCISADDKGRIYMLAGEDDEKGNMIYKITCLDKNQKEVWSSKIKANQDFEPLSMVTSDTLIAVLSNSALYLFDIENGKQQKELKLPGNEMLAKMCTDSRGNVLLVGWPKGKLTVWRLDEKALKFAKTGTYSGKYGYTDGIASGTDKYDFYLATTDSVYGFVTDGSKPTKVVDFLTSDQDFIEIISIAMLSQDSIMVLSYDEDMNSVPVLLKKQDEKVAGTIQTITLGCLSAPYSMVQDVYKYNKTSKNCKIKIIEYSPTDEDVGALNSVIATGDVPDIICVSDNMPIESYVNKEVFEEIEPYFRGDPEISDNEYLENILDAYRINGKMYFITPSFILTGLAGSVKDFGDAEGVSVDTIEKMIKKKGLKYEKVFGINNQSSVLGWITNYSNDQFVDLEKGTCNFDSQEFIKLLKFIKKFPKDFSTRLMQEDNSSWVRSGDQLMSEFVLSSVDIYMDMRYATFGEEIAFTGFPGSENGGPVIYSPYSLAICQDSKNIEAAWEFLRTYYLEKYQCSLSGLFPVSKKALDLQLKKSMEPEYTTYTDEKGKKITEQVVESSIIGGVKVTIPLPSEKDTQKVLSYIERAKKRSSVDVHISSIIGEEAGAFLAGQKSAEEVADIIQRRVSIYIKEMM